MKFVTEFQTDPPQVLISVREDDPGTVVVVGRRQGAERTYILARFSGDQMVILDRNAQNLNIKVKHE